MLGQTLTDAINPSHYQLPNNLQAIDLTEQYNFNLGNALKYILRAGNKQNNPLKQDLDKAVWYINRENSRIPQPNPTLTSPTPFTAHLPVNLETATYLIYLAASQGNYSNLQRALKELE